MFGYGIFVLVVTIIFAIYFIVMVNMDLSKLKKKSGADGEEVIHVNGGVEEPTIVNEREDGGYSMQRPGDKEVDYSASQSANQATQGQTDGSRQQELGVGHAASETPDSGQSGASDDKEDLTDADRQLLQQAQAANEQCDPVSTEVDGSVMAGLEADDMIESMAASMESRLKENNSNIGVKN